MSETALNQLLENLKAEIEEPIFEQLIVIIHQIWEKKYLAWKQSQSEQLPIPQFKAVHNFDELEKSINLEKQVSSRPFLMVEDVLDKAGENIENFSTKIFHQKKNSLKSFTLPKAKMGKAAADELELSFIELMKIIVNVVYLTCEDHPYYPENEEPEVLFPGVQMTSSVSTTGFMEEDFSSHERHYAEIEV